MSNTAKYNIQNIDSLIDSFLYNESVESELKSIFEIETDWLFGSNRTNNENGSNSVCNLDRLCDSAVRAAPQMIDKNLTEFQSNYGNIQRNSSKHIMYSLEFLKWLSCRLPYQCHIEFNKNTITHFTNFKSLGFHSAFGDVMKGSLIHQNKFSKKLKTNEDEAVIFKFINIYQPRFHQGQTDTSNIDKTHIEDAMSAFHELFIGLYAVNEIRSLIPNVIYTYGFVMCSDTKPQICTVNYPIILLETVNNSISLSKFLQKCTSLEFASITSQTFFTLQMLYEKHGFVHLDLHTDNILIQQFEDTELAIKYHTKKSANDNTKNTKNNVDQSVNQLVSEIKNKKKLLEHKQYVKLNGCLARLIDYGYSRIMYEKRVPLGFNDVRIDDRYSFCGIIFDVWKYLSFSLMEAKSSSLKTYIITIIDSVVGFIRQQNISSNLRIYLDCMLVNALYPSNSKYSTESTESTESTNKSSKFVESSQSFSQSYDNWFVLSLQTVEGKIYMKTLSNLQSKGSLEHTILETATSSKNDDKDLLDFMVLTDYKALPFFSVWSKLYFESNKYLAFRNTELFSFDQVKLFQDLVYNNFPKFEADVDDREELFSYSLDEFTRQCIDELNTIIPNYYVIIDVLKHDSKFFKKVITTHRESRLKFIN